MAEKSPAFQWYPADYLSDAKVQFLTSAQEGIYIRLLCYCWREGFVPSDPRQAMLSCKRDAKLRDVESVLSTFFVANSDGTGLVNPRLEKEREKQLERRHQASEAGRISATKRQRNGNDRSTTVQRPLDSRCHSVPTNMPTESNPSSSSSSSSSSSTTNEDKDKIAKPPKPKRTAPAPDTWLTPYGTVWESVFGGTMPFQKFAKALKGLEDIHGPPEVQDRWRRYCDGNRGRGEYASAQKFAQTFGQWVVGGTGPDLLSTVRDFGNRSDT